MKISSLIIPLVALTSALPAVEPAVEYDLANVGSDVEVVGSGESGLEAGIDTELDIDVETELEGRPACRVNARIVKTWVAKGMTRRKIHFSSVNTPAKRYCKLWSGDGPIHNVQCWKGPKTWQADVSYPHGPGGDDKFFSRHRDSLRIYKSSDEVRASTQIQLDITVLNPGAAHVSIKTRSSLLQEARK